MMARRLQRMITWFAVAVCMGSPSEFLHAGTLAYWRFEDRPSGSVLEAEKGSDTLPFTTTEDTAGQGNLLRAFNTKSSIFPPNTSGTFVAQPALPVSIAVDSNRQCLRLYGAEDAYTVSSAPIRSASLTAFTIEGFAKVAALADRTNGKFQVIVGKDGKPVSNLPFQPFAITIGGRDDADNARDCLAVHLLDRRNRYCTAASNRPLKENQWFAFAAVADGKSLKLFVNRFDGSGYQAEGSTSIDGGLINSTDDWTVGRGMHNNSPNSWFQGFVDEIRISGDALPPAKWLASRVKTLPVPPPAAPADPAPQLAVRDLADPVVLLHDGVYYLYGTGSPGKFGVWSSRDLKNWEKGPTIIERGPGVWGDGAFWAPGIVERNGKIYLYYSTSGIMPDTGGQRSVRINIAVSDSPMGPFKEVVPRLPLLGRAVIDPQPLIDDDGKAYLYFVADISENNGHGQIYAARLSDDLLSVVGEPVPCISPSQPWEGTTWNEGPFVFKEGDTYVLMYSGEFWGSHNYAVGFATSPTPTGPWQKCDDNPFLYRYGGLLGTGHDSVVRAPDGKSWLIFFHAHRNAHSSQRDTYFAKMDVSRNARGSVVLKVVPYDGKAGG